MDQIPCTLRLRLGEYGGQVIILHCLIFGSSWCHFFRLPSVFHCFMVHLSVTALTVCSCGMRQCWEALAPLKRQITPTKSCNFKVVSSCPPSHFFKSTFIQSGIDVIERYFLYLFITAGEFEYCSSTVDSIKSF